jgi:CRISPR/Cas system endoribonuclease Cas6 (RAMP superfamily)
LNDEQITQLITQRGNTIFKKLSPTYQKAVQETIGKILKADEANGKNILLETLSPNLIENFKEFNGLKFDFTQFKPRAHYTTDALLKTYFMAVKRLMREKLFFADQDVTKASLIMVNNIQDKDLVNFTTFYNAIQKLIGEDDDVNINDLQKFI